MPTENAFAQEYRPTFAERFWRRAGWRYHLVELPETPEVEKMPGWAITTVRIDFSVSDRLRLLLLGKLRLDIRQKMDVDVAEVVSAASHYIVRPGERP